MTLAGKTQLLIIGAGPFALATSARAKRRGIEHVVVGKPLSFWRRNMPQGMLLRSGYDWHLDPEDVHTFEQFLDVQGQAADLPIPLGGFLEYAEWFVRQKDLRITDALVVHLNHERDTFVAELDDGSVIRTPTVVCAPGFFDFRHVPEDLVQGIEPEHWSHSADICRLDRFANQRCLIVGGRQSAFETAALIAEAGAKAVAIVHRHPSPQYTESDWSWVEGDLRTAESNPGWFARLPKKRQESIAQRFWAEGRMKLEPWLEQRVRRSEIAVYENTTLRTTVRKEDDGYTAFLAGQHERACEFDHLILATGFRVDLSRIRYMNGLLSKIETVDGSPVLNETFESATLNGLYFMGLVAAAYFGPYMGFLASCRFSSRVVADSIAARDRLIGDRVNSTSD